MKIREILKDTPGTDKIRFNGTIAEIINFLEQDIPETKETGSEIDPLPEPEEIEFTQIKPKRTKEAQEQINAIKEAHAKVRAEKEKPQKEKTQKRRKLDIDNSLIVYMVDEQGKSYTEIAKEIRCSIQTVINRYNKGKRGW